MFLLGLDIFGSVYEDANWSRRTTASQKTFHRNCAKYIQTKSKLIQAKKQFLSSQSTYSGSNTVPVTVDEFALEESSK